MSSLPKTQEFNSVVPLPSPHWGVFSLTLPPESLPAQSAPCPAGHPRVQCGAVVSDAVIAAHRARAGKGGLQHLGALKARPWQKCQEPNTRCCCFFQHTHTRTRTCMHTTAEPHVHTHACVFTRVCVYMHCAHPFDTHALHTSTHLSTHTNAHPLHDMHHTTRVCTQAPKHTPQRMCIFPPTHHFRPALCASDTPRNRGPRERSSRVLCTAC